MSKTAAERQRDSRQRKRDKDVTKNVTCHTPDVTTEMDCDGRRASLADYQDEHGRKYAHRVQAVALNWGPWMNSQQLTEAGLVANRMPMPGDWDYEGVVQAAGPAPVHEQAQEQGKGQARLIHNQEQGRGGA